MFLGLSGCPHPLSMQFPCLVNRSSIGTGPTHFFEVQCFHWQIWACFSVISGSCHRTLGLCQLENIDYLVGLQALGTSSRGQDLQPH